MPYYIFELPAESKSKYIDSKEKYRDARELIRTLRKKSPDNDKVQFRMVFASTVAQAEILLSAPPKNGGIVGDD